METISKERKLDYLEEAHGILSAFPFTEEQKEDIVVSNLKKVQQETVVKNNDIDNSLYWAVSTILELLEDKNVNALNELLTFIEKVLEEEK